MQSNPSISVNLLVILAKILVNLLVKLTKSGQGGAIGAWGSRDDLSPRPSWACTGAPDQLQGLHLAEGQGRHAFGLAPRAREKHQERENNGYPFTTFSGFFRLSWDIILRVSVKMDLVVGR